MPRKNPIPVEDRETIKVTLSRETAKLVRVRAAEAGMSPARWIYLTVRESFIVGPGEVPDGFFDEDAPGRALRHIEANITRDLEAQRARLEDITPGTPRRPCAG